MRWLPVHCCCHPETRLGWVPVPAPIAMRLGRVAFIANTSPSVTRWPEMCPETGEVKTIVTEIAQLTTVGNGPTILAVKSAHEPIEVWRRVPGFTEQEPPRLTLDDEPLRYKSRRRES